MPRLKFDPVDLRLLAAFDSSFIVDDNNELASVSGCKIEIVRIDVDKLELTVVFDKVEFPILMSRSQTLKELHVADDS